MLIPFGEDIWIADGSDVTAIAGFRYSTRMAIVRLADGGLFVWSPVALDEGLRAAVDSVGRVEHIVAPNSLHDLFLAEWTSAWPDARLHAAPGLAAKRPDLAFDTTLGDTPDPGWSGCIEQVVVPGNAITTEVVFFHVASGTLLVTDLIQHHAADRFSGWRALVAKLDGMTGREPAVPRKFRMAFTGRRAAREAVGHILSWPVSNLVMAHGPLVTGEGGTVVRRAFRWLVPETGV